MRQLRIVWLCVMAMLAVGVFGASAQAAEVGECLKQARPYKGHYTDKNCTLVSGTDEGKWEWSPGVVSAHRAFTAKTGVVEFVGFGAVVFCRKSGTVGEWTGPRTSVETTTYEDCEFKSGFECHTAGRGQGVIASNPLVGTLIGHGETGPGSGEPATGEVWDSLASAEPSGIQMEFECAPVVVRHLGSVAGVWSTESLDHGSKKGSIAFNGVLGESPGKFGEQDLFVEASIGGGPFEADGQTVEKTTAKIKNSGKIEIRP